MGEAFIVDAVRTPMGRRGGTLSVVHPQELAATVLRGLVERNRIDPMELEDVIMGCVTPLGEQGFNIGRMAVLGAGFPVDVPGVQINRMCGSGLQAMNFAAQGIMAGMLDMAIGGGVESMSRVPMGSDGGNFSTSVTGRYNLVPQGISAEMIAERWHLTRTELDEFSLESHRRAAAAQDAGNFDNEIVPVTVPLPDGSTTVMTRDETIRRDTSLEKMATLKPSFLPDGLVTAGNSSQITDGAAAVLLASERKMRELGLRPRARVVTMALVGVDPTIMLTGPIPLTGKILKKAGLHLEDIDVIEINEAFASVVLAWKKEIQPDMSRVNPNGGAIALGHPLGATGARLIATLLNELERRQGRYGLAMLCIGLGMAVGTIIERV